MASFFDALMGVFDVLVTMDRGFRYQQSLKPFRLSVLIVQPNDSSEAARGEYP